MNQNHQFSDSENFQPTFNQLTFEQASAESSHIHPTNQQYNNTEIYQNVYDSQPQQINMNANSPIVQAVDLQRQIQNVHPIKFFFKPPNDFCDYHVNCKEVSLNIIDLLNESFSGNATSSSQNEYIFFYQQSNGQIYQVICEVIDSSLTLNKAIYGVEIEQNFGQDQLSFTPSQKENLKSYLTQHLSHYLLN